MTDKQDKAQAKGNDMESIPVTFLCAIHREFGPYDKDGVIIDAPKDGFISEMINSGVGPGLFDATGLSGDFIPDKPGLYRYDGVAIPADHPHVEDYFELTGKFTPIATLPDDWYKTAPSNQRCIGFI